MKAFKIKINGEEKVTAGIDDMSIVIANIHTMNMPELDSKNLEVADNDRPKFCMSLGGITDDDDQNNHVNWLSSEPLNLNDKIEIDIIETDISDPPKKLDQEILDALATNLKKKWLEAKKLYIKHKNEFEV
ncbi:MAG: hypothetical protein COA79_25830 [Planctomycetota bacterium]|nr:MAG: hypothetical protein COA79_25830 [Planctomycetota bacterium]